MKNKFIKSIMNPDPRKKLPFKGNVILLFNVMTVSCAVPFILYLVFYNMVEIPGNIIAFFVENIPSFGKAVAIVTQEENTLSISELGEMLNAASFALTLMITVCIPIHVYWLFLFAKFCRQNSLFKFPNNYYLTKFQTAKKIIIVMLGFAAAASYGFSLAIFREDIILEERYIGYAMFNFSIILALEFVYFAIFVLVAIYSKDKNSDKNGA